MFVQAVTETPRPLSLMSALPGPVYTCTWWWTRYLDWCALAVCELVTLIALHLVLVVNSLPGPVRTCTLWNRYLDQCALALGELVTLIALHLVLVVNLLPGPVCTCTLWNRYLDLWACAVCELVTLIALHLVHPAQAINLAPEVLTHSNIHNLNKAFYLIICAVDIVIQVKGILVWTSSGIPVNNL